MSIVKKFVKFLDHYGKEINSVAVALETIVSAVPMNKGEKAAILEVVRKLNTIPANLQQAIKDIQEPPKVMINFDDIKKAVANLLPDVVAKFFADKAKEETKK